MTRTGRRPGESGTRGAILEAARRSFAERGYDGATIRGIAARAGVDPALVHHYFGGKQALFVAALELPFEPRDVLREVMAGDVDTLGERLVRTLLSIWGSPGARRRLQALFRSAMSNERAARMVREFLIREIGAEVARAIDRPDPMFRATLIGSTVFGLATARYVLGVGPLAEAGEEEIVAAVGPTIQRYLTGDIGPDAGRGAAV